MKLQILKWSRWQWFSWLIGSNRSLSYWKLSYWETFLKRGLRSFRLTVTTKKFQHWKCKEKVFKRLEPKRTQKNWTICWQIGGRLCNEICIHPHWGEIHFSWPVDRPLFETKLEIRSEAPQRSFFKLNETQWMSIKRRQDSLKSVLTFCT